MNEALKKHSFANLDAATRQSVASLGGRTAHQLGKAHTFTSASARAAGLKGVETRRRNAAARAELLQKNKQVMS